MPPATQQSSVLDLPDHLLAHAFTLCPAADLPSVRWVTRGARPPHAAGWPPPPLLTSLPHGPPCRLTCKAFLRPATEAARGLKLRRLGGTQLQLSDMPRLREVDVAEVPGADWSEGFLLQLAEQVRGEFGVS